MADDYRAQLLAVEAKLIKEPDNEELLALKEDLIELIELSGSLEEDEQKIEAAANDKHHNTTKSSLPSSSSRQTKSDESSFNNFQKTATTTTTKAPCDSNNLVSHEGQDKGSSDINNAGTHRRTLTEAESLAKRKEKNRKKKAKLREKVKEQLDAAESVKQSWQSFANQRGLKGLTKRSIFASPCSVTGKVGVGTNGIADAPSASGASSASSGISSAPITTKRKY